MALLSGTNGKWFLIIIVITLICSIFIFRAHQHAILKREIAAIEPMINRLTEQFIMYANVHGKFPSTSQLGLDNLNNISTRPKEFRFNSLEFNKYEVLLWTADISNIASAKQNVRSSCGRSGIITGAVRSPVLDIRKNSTIAFTCLMANKNNKVESKCFYSLNADYVRLISDWEHVEINLTRSAIYDPEFFAGSVCMDNG